MLPGVDAAAAEGLLKQLLKLSRRLYVIDNSSNLILLSN